MKFLREQRLLRVHRELSEPCDSTTVTDVALKWGFCHLGRFSWYYSDQFGEKPSDTLAKAKAREKKAHPATENARAAGC
jgi:transcriptional regulator GlxA family with amidase domain